MPACAGMTVVGRPWFGAAGGGVAGFWIASSARFRGPPRNDPAVGREVSVVGAVGMRVKMADDGRPEAMGSPPLTRGSPILRGQGQHFTAEVLMPEGWGAVGQPYRGLGECGRVGG
jgi:hypothetical protein